LALAAERHRVGTLVGREESIFTDKMLALIGISYIALPASEKRNGGQSVASPLVSEPEGELMMHFRVFDLAAERCVWSIPPIDTVPWKLRTEKACGAFH
jgi:hypothetical protein